MKETIDFILMLALLGVTIWLGVVSKECSVRNIGGWLDDKEDKEEKEHSIWETNNKEKR